MSLSLSKEATWTSSHRYIYGIIFFSKGSYSIRPNSSPSDNIAAQIPTADNQRHLLIFFLGCRGRLESCLFLPGLSHIFVGHAPLSPAAVWVSVSSAHVFWARARQEFASVVFGHAFSHTAFQTDLLTSTHFAFFFFSPLSSFLAFFFFFFLLGGQNTTKSAAATNGLSNLSVCLTALGASCLKCTYRSGCVLIIHVDWQEHMKIHYFTVCKLPIATRSL